MHLNTATTDQNENSITCSYQRTDTYQATSRQHNHHGQPRHKEITSREYVVLEGWVSPRDFLLGLAIIQAFPRPNFNFAVFLGGLTAVYGGYNAAAGAILVYIGIFLPRIVTVHGTMGVWSATRGNRWVTSALRGINAAAVGLIYTAVYRPWQIGHVDEGFEAGKSLGDDPWWVVVAVTSYVGGMWFKVSAPVAIVLGAAMGLIRYGVVNGEH
ncbi:hypothetical protein EG329_006089 [Mollisiaceae sp. DMI_Dod_QoI]|nr:hypothetical protein EG329_006089 [Helotiales sp. DMI_Dod_QoI]